MVESTDSLDFPPELIFQEERKAIPLKCWQDVCLSNIWIPSHLLPSRKKPPITRTANINFHRLQKKDAIQCLKTFSVYSEEIFVSDSDEDSLDCNDGAKYEERLPKNTMPINTGFAVRENSSSQEKEKLLHISLNDILDDTPQVNASNFRTKGEFLSLQEKKLDPNQKKNKKKKKATAKHVTLDAFLEDYSEGDYQNDCCNDYFQKILSEKNKKDGIQIKNAAEFPNLGANFVNFNHSEKLKMKNPEPSLKTLAEILCPSNEINENAIINCDQAAGPNDSETEYERGKLVIENIPNEVRKEDIYSFLCGYGEIINFTVESVGKFLKAHVEIDLNNDIDWIIECLNGSEPFGASPKMLKCYKQE